MASSRSENEAGARRFFDVGATFEKPVLPKRREHQCRFSVTIRAVETEEAAADKKAKPKKESPPTSHICLVLDLSGSMSVSGKYELLQEALRAFIERVTENIFVSAVAFSEGAEQIIYARSGNRLRARTLLKELDRSRVKFGGATEMAAGMRVAERLCRLFSSEYPTAITRIYMMTDGMVHDHRECLRCAERFAGMEAEVHTFGIGRGDYDLAVLRDISARCIGGSVKLIKNVDRFVLALDRVGKTTARIFATGVKLAFRMAPGVLCNQVFLFRPREMDASKSISDDSSSWEFGGWPSIESKRTYQLLFETLLPSDEGDTTFVGAMSVEGKVGDEYFREEIPVTVRRDDKAQSEPNEEVKKAFASCAVLSSKDPDIILEALEAKRDLYILEKRHKEDIQEIEDRIQEVKTMKDNLFDLDEDAFEDVGDVGDCISIDTLGGGNGESAGGLAEDIGIVSAGSSGNGDVSNGSLDDDEPDIGEPFDDDNPDDAFDK